MKVSIYLAFLILLLLNCSKSQSACNEKIVLQVGKLQFTDYEVEKNINIYKTIFSQKTGRQPNEKELKQWELEYIERAYILADAYKKGFDTIISVNKKVTGMAHFIVSQPGGLLEQKLIEDSLNVTDNEIKKAIPLSNKQIEIQYLKFNDYDSAIHVLGALQLKTIEDFENVVQKSTRLNGVLYKKEVLTWPLMKWLEHEDYIFKLKKGDIISFMAYNDGYYLILVENTKNKNCVADFIDKRTYIINALKSQKRVKILYRNKMEAMNGSTINYNMVILADISKVIASTGEIHEFDKDKFATFLKQTVLKYKMDSHEVNVSFNDFVDYYNELPIRYKIGNIYQLKTAFDAMVLQACNYHTAEKIGITLQPKFILDRENFKKNTIYSMYENTEIKKWLGITEDEINKYYEFNKVRYIQASNVIVTLYTFNTKERAFTSMRLICGGENDTLKCSQIKEFQNIQRHVNISYNTNNYPDTFINVIFSMKVNQASMPISMNDKYYIAYKENELGTRVRELREVKSIIRKEIAEKKLKQIKDSLVLILKSCYTVKNNIDIHKYAIQKY